MPPATLGFASILGSRSGNGRETPEVISDATNPNSFAFLSCLFSPTNPGRTGRSDLQLPAFQNPLSFPNFDSHNLVCSAGPLLEPGRCVTNSLRFCSTM